MQPWIDRRRAAVLLHITALPGPFHQGVLGEEARLFIDNIIAGGFSVWQFLPLGPTHGHGSPYESLSTFAGNPELIDWRDCVKHGWLNQAQLQPDMSAQQHADCRSQASQNFWAAAANNPDLQQQITAFHQKNADWLDDFALFSALKSVTNNHAWWQWSPAIRDREPIAIQAAKAEHHELVQQVIFEQYLFDRQWFALKTYAEQRGVQLFGDLPIYVAHDSADVWANPSFFTLNKQGLCTEVAGVPPDYFSETGQRWGNPLYRWSELKKDGFAWWIRRVKHQLSWMHMLRIDHFRALEAFWVIPGNSEDGVIGQWRTAPGAAMLKALQQSLGKLPLIAEDLGIITDEVTALRESFALPGMKILHFAFGGGSDNPYLPEHHEENGVVYTGTHDNDTTMGWFAACDDNTRNHVLSVLGGSAEDMPWLLIEAALASPAKLAVIPMQDLLALGTEAKFNTPGTLHGNWSWRLAEIPAPDADCWQHSLSLNQQYQR